LLAPYKDDGAGGIAPLNSYDALIVDLAADLRTARKLDDQIALLAYGSLKKIPEDGAIPDDESRRNAVRRTLGAPAG
jgi:hypothetical protein